MQTIVHSADLSYYDAAGVLCEAEVTDAVQAYFDFVGSGTIEEIAAYVAVTRDLPGDFSIEVWLSTGSKSYIGTHTVKDGCAESHWGPFAYGIYEVTFGHL